MIPPAPDARWLDWTVGVVASLFAWSGLVWLIVVTTRQPLRRVELARLAFVVALLFPLLMLGSRPRVDLPATLGQLAAPPPQTVKESQGAAARPDPGPRLVWVDPDERRRDPPARWVTGLAWVAIALAALAPFAVVALGFAMHWVVGQMPPLSPRVLAGLEESDRAGPPARVSRRMRVPGLVGCLRPAIVIPGELDHPARLDDLRLALAHERAHARAGDHLWAAVSPALGIAGLLVWPLRWLLRQSLIDAEILADIRAARSLALDPVDYTRRLLGIAPWSHGAAAHDWPWRERLSGPAIVPNQVVGPTQARVIALTQRQVTVEDHVPWRWRLVAWPAVLLLAVAVVHVDWLGQWATHAGDPTRPLWNGLLHTLARLSG